MATSQLPWLYTYNISIYIYVTKLKMNLHHLLYSCCKRFVYLVFLTVGGHVAALRFIFVPREPRSFPDLYSPSLLPLLVMFTMAELFEIRHEWRQMTCVNCHPQV